MTFGFLLHVSQLSQHSGLIVPEEFLAPRCLLFKLWAFKISLQIPVCHWVTSRNPSSCFILLTPKALYTVTPAVTGSCLFIYNCSASADLGRVPKHRWELTCSYTRTTHVSSPISADSQKALTLHAGCDPRITHCSWGAHWLLTCPLPCHNAYFLHCLFLHFVKTLLASQRNTLYSATCEHRVDGEMNDLPAGGENGPQRCPCPNFWNYVTVLLYVVKGTLQVWKSRVCQNGEIILDYPCRLNVITRVLIRGRQENQSEKMQWWKKQRQRRTCGNTTLLASKTEGGALRQGMWAVTRLEKTRKQIHP